MARDPADRYRSAGDFAKDLATVLAQRAARPGAQLRRRHGRADGRRRGLPVLRRTDHAGRALLRDLRHAARRASPAARPVAW